MISITEQLVKLEHAALQSVNIPFIDEYGVQVDVLRLDKIHPLISGNKWFKLKYNLKAAIAKNKHCIVTIGGAYSNHIVATAAACNAVGFTSFGLIKGVQPAKLSCTLRASADLGMQIVFKPKNFFRETAFLPATIEKEYPDSFFIEEGGRNENGILGSAEILMLVKDKIHRYVCCSIGTGTMMAGIVNASTDDQQVLGFSSLKISNRENELARFIRMQTNTRKNYEIIYDYHFGGYGRYNRQLLEFMNWLYEHALIPTDIVYTGKLFYGVLNLIQSKYFQPGTRILVIHSGGLQGNCSLPAGTLLF